MKIKMIVILTCMLLVITGCNQKEPDSDTIKNFDVAVVESISTKLKSRITYYDQNLKKVKETSLSYADFGTNFKQPVYFQNEVFIIPAGLQGIGGNEIVVGIDLKTGTHKEYDIDMSNIQTTAVNSNYIFAASNKSVDSFLTRFDKKTKETKSITLDNELITILAAKNDHVYSFSFSLLGKDQYCKLRVYDQDLKLVHEKDITELGIGQNKYCIDGDKLYFTNPRDKEDKPSNVLGIFNMKTNELEQVKLDHDFPDNIQKIDDHRLLISCTDVVVPEGTNVIVFDMDTKKTTSYDLKMPIVNTAIANNRLYVLNMDHEVAVFQIDHEFKQENIIKHDLKEAYAVLLFSNNV